MAFFTDLRRTLKKHTRMNDTAILFLPTMYVFAVVTGFMLNSCSKRKLEEQNYELEWMNKALKERLEEVERKLIDMGESLSESSTDS